MKCEPLNFQLACPNLVRFSYESMSRALFDPHLQEALSIDKQKYTAVTQIFVKFFDIWWLRIELRGGIWACAHDANQRFDAYWLL